MAITSLSDAPNTQREYETIYILRPTTTNEAVGEVNDRVRNIIDTMGGKVLKVDNWGKRRLAYEVAKERKGIYLYWQYLATPGVVDEFERNMRMLDPVIRYMTVKVDADIDPEARPTDVDDEMYERAAATAADEEDMFLTRGGDDSDSDSDYDNDYDSDYGKSDDDDDDDSDSDSDDDSDDDNDGDDGDDDDDDDDDATAAAADEDEED